MCFSSLKLSMNLVVWTIKILDDMLNLIFFLNCCRECLKCQLLNLLTSTVTDWFHKSLKLCRIHLLFFFILARFNFHMIHHTSCLRLIRRVVHLLFLRLVFFFYCWVVVYSLVALLVQHKTATCHRWSLKRLRVT